MTSAALPGPYQPNPAYTIPLDQKVKTGTPLHYDVTHSNAVNVKILLDRITEPSKAHFINEKDDSGDSPLAHVRTNEIARALLAAGADPYLENKQGQTPLCFVPTEEVAAAYTEFGIDFERPNSKGQTPLQQAAALSHSPRMPEMKRSITTALLSAGVRVDAATVRTFLFSAAPEDRSIGRTLATAHFKQNQATYATTTVALSALFTISLRAVNCATSEEAPQDDSFLVSLFSSPTPPQTFGECFFSYGKV